MTLKTCIIPILLVVSVIGLLIIGPIPQDQYYHAFADPRRFIGVPNFLNVITNLPFFFVGIAGMVEGLSIREKSLRQIVCVLFSSFLLLTFGSGYYHWSPTNHTLVHDRVPISVISMTFFSFIIYRSFDKMIGHTCFIIFNVAGVLTVLYWIWTEQTGIGDLRWYGLVQFFPIVAIPLILVLFKTPFSKQKELLLIFVFFAIAKAFETFDKRIYHLLNNFISGHSLKHLFMATAGYQLIKLVQSQKASS